MTREQATIAYSFWIWIYCLGNVNLNTNQAKWIRHKEKDGSRKKTPFHNNKESNKFFLFSFKLKVSQFGGAAIFLTTAYRANFKQKLYTIDSCLSTITNLSNFPDFLLFTSQCSANRNSYKFIYFSISLLPTVDFIWL